MKNDEQERQAVEADLPEFDDFFGLDDSYCQRCGGEGFIIVCCDDMCRGAGECMHGDGEIVCPDCHGKYAW